MDDASLARRLGDALGERDETIAVAESCTGGLLGSTITAVPGSSGYFVGGVISYMNATKRRFLAISRESLERHGAVSEPVAREMARHVRDEADADWAISTTGYAGPAAGSDAPVGTVYVGIARAAREAAGASASAVERFQFDGDRHGVREQVVSHALRSTIERIERE